MIVFSLNVVVLPTRRADFLKIDSVAERAGIEVIVVARRAQGLL